jgi:signal peptidase I
VDTLRMRGGRWASLGVATLADVALCTLVALVGWLVVGVLLGLSPVVVSSGSMSPLLRTGDVLLNGAPGTEVLGPGTVVTFDAGASPQAMADDGASPSDARLVSHRVVASGPGGYTTRGDANHAADRQPVPHGAVVGVGRVLVPFVGLPAVWARQGSWALLAAVAVGLVAVASQSTILGRRSTVSARHRDGSAAGDLDGSADEAPVTDLEVVADVEAAADVEAIERAEVVTDLEVVADAALDALAAGDGAHDDGTLWPVAPDKPITSEVDGEPLWPEEGTDAEVAAARAAEAARRSGRSLRALDQLGDDTAAEDDPEHALRRAVARVTDLHDGVRGSGARALLAVALLLGVTLGHSPSTEAAFVAASTAPDNRFATASATATAFVFVLPTVAGDPIVTSGNGNQSRLTTFSTTTTQATRVQGPAQVIARVSNTQGGNVSRDVEVTLRIDGQVVATGARRGLPSMPSWTDVTVDLGTVDRAVPAGAVVTVTVELQRLQLQVGGPTVVTLGTT